MEKKRRKKRSGRAGILFTILVLCLLLILAVGKLRRSSGEEMLPEPEKVQQSVPEEEKPTAEIPEETPEAEPGADPEAERASFLPDYTSAPLLNTTAIKCLSMEVGSSAEEVRFNWLSPSASKGAVLWKNADTGETQTFEAKCTASTSMTGYYVNKASVTGLTPGTSYTYQVGNEDAWSPEYAYRAPEASGNNLTFLVTSDAQVGQSEIEDPKTTAERWDSVLTRLTGYVPEAKFLFHLGDQVADFGSAEHYDLFLDHLALYRIPLAPLVGNHDVANDYSIEENGHPGGPYFSEHFNVPNVSSVGQSQYDPTGDYYFIRDNVLFLVLNSNTNQPSEVHESYVAQIVAEHPEVQWRILAQHYPAYSGTKDSHTNSKEYLARIASDNGIDLVLSGHDHAYSRTAFVNRDCETLNDYDYEPGDSATNPEGTMYVTCGTSSGCLYHFREEEIRIVYQVDENEPIAMRIDITDQELHLRTYLVDTWNLCDEYTIRKE